jgi:hypothetical protein
MRYSRIIMLMVLAGVTKTTSLQDLHEISAVPLINVNTDLFSPLSVTTGESM